MSACTQSPPENDNGASKPVSVSVETASHPPPEMVIITGGLGLGGVTSFAEALREGFLALGIQVEIIPPSAIFRHWRDLRDPRVLKILSTTAVFAAPFARRAICMAHGVARAYLQSLLKMAVVNGTFKLANVSKGAQLVAVSNYSAIHLKVIFAVRVDAVIHNPIRSMFLEQAELPQEPRRYITFVGRLDPIKNLHRLLPAVCNVLDDDRDLRVCIIGDGQQRDDLESLAQANPRIELKGWQDARSVRGWLRKTRVFISADVTEPFGIVYVEALGQGCAIAMPASGGGLEIAPHLIGRTIHLFPASLERDAIASALRRALNSSPEPLSLDAYAPREVALAYLAVDQRFSETGSSQWPR